MEQEGYRNLELPIQHRADDPRIIARMKQSLAKTFKGTRPTKVDEAVLLAAYLYAIGRKDETLGITKLFTENYSHEDFDTVDIWGAAGNGILLHAYVLRECGLSEKANAATLKIRSFDIVADGKRENHMEDVLAEMGEDFRMAASESQKWACNIYGITFLELVYCSEMLPHFSKEHRFEEKISHTLKLLSDSILNFRRRSAAET